MPLVADYSWSRPDPGLLRAHYIGVMRYISGSGRGKDIDPGEYARLHSAGLSVGLVWETSAGRALQGAGAGAADAQAANRQADQLGFPRGRPIYYAVDTDVSGFGAVADYLAGARNQGLRPVGVYGEYDVVDTALANGAVRYGWQTVAWSNRRRTDRAHLYQYARNPQVAGCDDNEVLQADWGQDQGSAQPSEEDDLPYSQQALEMIVVHAVREALGQALAEDPKVRILFVRLVLDSLASDEGKKAIKDAVATQPAA